jgi:hypothetical protein
MSAVRRPYAEGTTIDVTRSRAELEKLLRRYGAEGFAFAWHGPDERVEFAAHGRRLRFEMTAPARASVQVRGPQYGQAYADKVDKALEAERRRRWRCLLLAVKAKLEVVESGIATFEEEFLAHVVMPNGETVGRWATPQLRALYEGAADELRLLPGRAP